MPDIPRAALWAAGGSLLAVGIAWALTSPGAQDKLSAHVSVALGSGGGEPLPGQPSPIKTGVSVEPWQPLRHGRNTGRLATRHPRSCSPGITALQARGYDWMFCPPSEGDI